jgi:hypothetical protein
VPILIAEWRSWKMPVHVHPEQMTMLRCRCDVRNCQIIAGVNTVEDIYFAAFSGEEQGFWGSTAYAQYMKDKRINLQKLSISI